MIGLSNFFTIKLTACDGTKDQVKRLEHVKAIVTVTSPRRGDLIISLTSPMKTTSILLPRRPRDDSTEGFQSWSFMSVQFWAENPIGQWTLNISYTGSVQYPPAILKSWALVLYGTDSGPDQLTPVFAPPTEGYPVASFPITLNNTSRSMYYTVFNLIYFVMLISLNIFAL